MRFGDEGELRLCLGSWGQLLPGFTWPLRMHGIIRILSNVPELNRYDTFLTKEIYILHTWPLILYVPVWYIDKYIYFATENAWNN